MLNEPDPPGNDIHHRKQASGNQGVTDAIPHDNLRTSLRGGTAPVPTPEYSSRYSPPNSQMHTRPIISDNQPQIYEYRHGQSTNKTLGNVQPKVDKNLSLPTVGDLAHATINTSVHNPVVTIEHASDQNNLRGRTQSKPVYHAGQAAIKRTASNVVTNHDSSCETNKQHHSSSSFLCGASPPNWWM